MTNRNIILALLILLAMVATSKVDAQASAAKSRIESERIAFITSYVNLTPEEAKSFWPLYNEFQDQLVTRKNITIREGSEMGEQEAAEQIDRHFNQEQEQLDLKREYVAKFRTILSAKKTYLLFEGERKFKSRLLRIMNERRQKQQR